MGLFFCRTRTSSPLEASGRGNHPRNVKSPGDTRQIGNDFQGLRSVAVQLRLRGEIHIRPETTASPASDEKKKKRR